MKDLTLVVMAAGMGSRFGGLKQIEPVGPSDEIIADYSVYDAINAGFTKVVFIIRKENEDYFKENITKKFQDKIKVEFAFQELDMLPDNANVPKDRVKMLGTAHAILCAKEKIDGDFAVLNADDFYGSNAFKVVSEFLNNEKNKDINVCVNYRYCDTASIHGAVKRGVINTDNKNNVLEIIESEIAPVSDNIIARKLVNDEEFKINKDTAVSMNFFGLRKEILDILESDFQEFIHGDVGLKNEFLLPEVLNKAIKSKKIMMKSLDSNSKWMGVTYREDLAEFKEEIEKLINNGVYPRKLW